jgi:hypothetical protein
MAQDYAVSILDARDWTQSTGALSMNVRTMPAASIEEFHAEVQLVDRLIKERLGPSLAFGI